MPRLSVVKPPSSHAAHLLSSYNLVFNPRPMLWLNSPPTLRPKLFFLNLFHLLPSVVNSLPHIRPTLPLNLCSVQPSSICLFNSSPQARPTVLIFLDCRVHYRVHLC